jgi:hypothetical protein
MTPNQAIIPSYTKPSATPQRVTLEAHQLKDLEDKAHQLWKSIMTCNKAMFLRHNNLHRPDNDEMQQ